MQPQNSDFCLKIRSLLMLLWCVKIIKKIWSTNWFLVLSVNFSRKSSWGTLTHSIWIMWVQHTILISLVRFIYTGQWRVFFKTWQRNSGWSASVKTKGDHAQALGMGGGLGINILLALLGKGNMGLLVAFGDFHVSLELEAGFVRPLPYRAPKEGPHLTMYLVTLTLWAWATLLVLLWPSRLWQDISSIVASLNANSAQFVFRHSTTLMKILPRF